MIRRRRENKTLSRVIFFLPVLVIIGVIAYQLIAYTSLANGTLIIIARSSDRFSPAHQLSAEVLVNGITGTTPLNVSLKQGLYNVTFYPVRWYSTPHPRYVQVLAGRVAYAVGVYSPIVKYVGVTGVGFNSTRIVALHGVTPVVWINLGSSYAVLNIQPVGRVILSPGQNFTHVFQDAGSFGYSLMFGNSTGLVEVV